MNSEKNKEKIIELLMKLEKKEIDQDTFNQEYDKLVNSEEYKKNIKEANKIDFSFLLNPKCIVLIVAAIFLIIYSLVSPYIGREYIYAEDYHNLESPIQEEYSDTKTFKVNGTEIQMDMIYTYKIRGMVVDKLYHLPTSLTNKFIPMDVGLAWGYILNEEGFKDVRWNESLSRRLYWTSKNSTWLNKVDYMEGLYSNSHLIPKDNKIKSKLKKIRKGDYIEIEGYLVNLYWDTGTGKAYWESSTTRDDSGDGACETIYVTSVKWLKEEK